MDSLARSSLICRALEIDGWFDESELDLLIQCVIEVSLRFRGSEKLNILEIGSYKVAVVARSE
jgi:hypothetical protein